MFSKLFERYINFLVKHLFFGCMGSILLFILLGLTVTILCEYNEIIPISIFVFVLSYILYFLYNESKQTKKDEIKCIEIGQILFKDNVEEFNEYYTRFLKNKKDFIKTYSKSYKFPKGENDEPSYTDVFIAFAKNKKKITRITIKWEENEYTINDKIKSVFNISFESKNLEMLYSEIKAEKREKYKFVIDVLKNIDEDLKTIGKSLIFINDSDYMLLCENTEIVKKIESYKVESIYGVKNLK